MKHTIEKWATFFLISASVFVSALLTEAAILTFTGQFKLPYIYFSLIPAFIVVILFSIRLKRDINLLPTVTISSILIFFLISLILIFFPHDTFGGADQAIYSNLASHLANSASFKIASYLNNLPGNYAEDIRTWYQGYPIWLGIQVAFFGFQWMLRSNVVIIILGLSSFFLVSSHLGGNRAGTIASILLSSSMPFLWFSKETMSENLSFFLLWSLILFLLIFLKTKKYIYLAVVFICSWLFGLTRFEGFLLQFVLLCILPALLFIRKIKLGKICLIITISTFLLISNIYITKDIFLPIFFTKFVPGIILSIKRDAASLIPNYLMNAIPNNPIPNAKSATLNEKLPFFIFQMMAKYNFVLIIFSIFLISFQTLTRIKKLDRSKLFFFIILILFIPEYYKLISPNVTLAQPWLYRRYIYALLPLGYLCFTLLLSQFNNKRFLISIACCVLLINLSLSIPIIFLKDNWLLVDKMEEISKNFSQKDLVLIDYRPPLNNYDVRTYLIVQKGVRTLLDWQLVKNKFIPEDKLFNDLPYEKIFYLSASEQNEISFPLFRIVKQKEVDVHYVQLIPSCQLSNLGIEEGLVNPYNIGKLSYSSATKYCNLPKNEIAKHSHKLYLYELIYNGNAVEF